MRRRKVVIAQIVQNQITAAQALHIAADSIDHALAWEERLRVAIQNLGEVSGFAVDEEASGRLGFPVRKYVFEDTYIVHYNIDDATETIRVLNFRHGSRLPRAGEP